MIPDPTSDQIPSTNPVGLSPINKRSLQHVRHAHILGVLAAHGSLQATVIASELAVSDMTIRRDLIDLESAGKLMRVHGGALVLEKPKPVDIDRDEPSFASRMQRNRGAKEKIAAAASILATGCRAIALDVGTTTYLTAVHLRDRDHAKIFTNSVRIAAELSTGTAEVYLPGGRIRTDEMSIGGPNAAANFDSLWFDIAFVGVSGITDEGLYDYSFEDADLKRVYLRRSGLRVVLCDASKFQRKSLVQIASLKDFDVLLTDAEPPASIAAALAEFGVQVQIAPDIKSPT